jgi:hypothetical protein
MQATRTIDPILERIRTSWRLCGELKLGELLISAASFVNRDLSDLEDDELVTTIEKFVKARESYITNLNLKR